MCIINATDDDTFNEDMLNVELFNEWFCDKDNGANYAHSGIFLRTSKLGMSQIDEFLFIKFNVNCEKIEYQVKYEFYNAIQKDWMKQLRKNIEL